MNNSEFSDQFDVLYNNITSNQAPGLNEYEKSVFLTKAEKEIVKNYFSAGSLGNNLHQGFDDSAKRQADFSVLMKTALCTQVSSPGTATSPRTFIFTTDEETIVLHGVTFTNTTTLEEESLPDGEYYCQYQGNALQTYFAASGNVYTIDTDESGEEIPSVNCTLKVITNAADRIDPRSGVWSFPSDVFIVINEALYTVNSKILQLVPLRYDEYTRLMSKPFKYPVKNQAWRLMNSGTVNSGSTSTKLVEIITNTWDNVASYHIRYIRTPKPIILAPLGGMSIDGYYGSVNGVPTMDATAAVTGGVECELDPILHEEILQRAVELAKVAWTSTGQDNTQIMMEAGKRSE